MELAQEGGERGGKSWQQSREGWDQPWGLADGGPVRLRGGGETAERWGTDVCSLEQCLGCKPLSQTLVSWDHACLWGLSFAKQRPLNFILGSRWFRTGPSS